MRVQTDVPLAPLTTLRLGGAASRMAEAECEQDVADASREAQARGESMFVLGAGSNVVVLDEGFAGLVLRMRTRGIESRIEPGGVVVDVAAGENWDDLVARGVDEGWCGIEAMSGIPGWVGATPIQNVGAYGQEVRDTIVAVRVYDRTSHGFVELRPDECHFGYRSSVFKGSRRWIVTGVRFAFARGPEAPVRYADLARSLAVDEGACAPLRAVREAVLALRRAKGMVLDPGDPESVSAGSFFVNPVVDASTLAAVAARAGAAPPSFPAGDGKHKIAAGWLVERAGFVKGWGPGRVGVSSKHALALVHRGGATTAELLALARTIRDGVRASLGVTLVPEPVLVGGSWEERGL
jgi:UDP-N-acetylmuramate dehydrogenase